MLTKNTALSALVVDLIRSFPLPWLLPLNLGNLCVFNWLVSTAYAFLLGCFQIHAMLFMLFTFHSTCTIAKESIEAAKSVKKMFVSDQILKRMESKVMFLEKYVGHASYLSHLFTTHVNLIGNHPWWCDLHVLPFCNPCFFKVFFESMELKRKLSLSTSLFDLLIHNTI